MNYICKQNKRAEHYLSISELVFSIIILVVSFIVLIMVAEQNQAPDAVIFIQQDYLDYRLEQISRTYLQTPILVETQELTFAKLVNKYYESKLLSERRGVLLDPSYERLSSRIYTDDMRKQRQYIESSAKQTFALNYFLNQNLFKQLFGNYVWKDFNAIELRLCDQTTCRDDDYMLLAGTKNKEYIQETFIIQIPVQFATIDGSEYRIELVKSFSSKSASQIFGKYLLRKALTPI